MRKKRWADLTPNQQTAVLVLVSIELSLTATALVDLIRVPAAEIRGSKRRWALVLLVQPVGPIAYLAWGRAPVSRG